MKSLRPFVGWIFLTGMFFACEESQPFRALIPGPAQEGYDAALEEVARQRDRQFHVFHTLPTGVNAEISISRDKTAERQAVEDFLRSGDGWDFEAATGFRVDEVADAWWKVAGAYAGAGIAADAFRYGVMRDQSYPGEEVDRARQQLLRGLQGLHLAVEITGVEGVIARGYANRDYPGAGQEQTVPLFDQNGNPLPEPKNNGTWREDNSGAYPNFIWEDSCSRDMLIGWVMGFGAAWEVIRGDRTVPQPVKDTMRDDARAVVFNLRTVRENGYDLELMDADLRTTYHGYLNENNLDRMYVDGIRNGFHTLMVLGIVGALADVAQDAEVDAYLHEELIRRREFDVIAWENLALINMNELTNFSNYNMAFQGAWLALRHLQDEQARYNVQQTLQVNLYDSPDYRFMPAEQKQTFYDLVYAVGRCDASAWWPCRKEPDQGAIDRGLETLREFPSPPFWDFQRLNCDPEEIQSGDCTAVDGTHLKVLGYVGRNGDLITAQPLAMRIRPPSNYYWRSNPYAPNGGSEGPAMFPSVDFRLAYWLGRWVRR